jgi:hypothetical protein
MLQGPFRVEHQAFRSELLHSQRSGRFVVGLPSGRPIFLRIFVLVLNCPDLLAGSRHSAFQKLRELFGQLPVGKKVPLPFAASFFLKKMQLFLGLHALSDHAMLQAFSDVNERAQNRGTIRIRGSVIDEPAIYFQGIQREFSQIAEAGIADPKNRRQLDARRWLSARAASAPLIPRPASTRIAFGMQDPPHYSSEKRYDRRAFISTFTRDIADEEVALFILRTHRRNGHLVG